ncbi:hypothetical protein [Filimonas effusa]|uniref:Uncharacterized protein n=1 Tax=Filimonas effusa TaxID=2508721 RepID=A0A4Q1CZA9_9BACT|nr:hypothetical protein [Filimonas effusa]RXK80738.1 hypothetical protein ESB13_21470 [Filimonas effusa]
MSISFNTTVALRIGYIVFAILAYLIPCQLFPVSYQVADIENEKVAFKGDEEIGTWDEYYTMVYTDSDESFRIPNRYLKEEFNIGDTFVVARNLVLKPALVNKRHSTYVYPVANHDKIEAFVLFFTAPALLTLAIWRRKHYARDSSAILILCTILVIIVLAYYII